MLSWFAQDTSALNFVALLVAYLGTELAPYSLIERMLWPQRFSSDTNAGSIKNALFLSLGGPMHKVVIRAVEIFRDHGLLKGQGQGHLLGTAFFADTRIPYTLHRGDGQPAEEEHVRNGLLVRILKCMSDTSVLPKHADTASTMRQQITVSHLQLFNFDNMPPQKPIALDAAYINTRTILSLLLSELPTFILVILTTYLHTPLSGSLFLIPVVLKLAFAMTALHREDLVLPAEKVKPSSSLSSPSSSLQPVSPPRSMFEIHIPGTGFQVISGPTDLILPFFRHYGHPLRCRWRECAQMCLVAAAGFVYPVTLLATTFCMPLQVRALWVAYQVYLLFAMMLARFGGGEVWGSTEERVAKALVEAEKGKGGGIVVLRNREGEMIGARVERRVCGSYSEGKREVGRIIGA